MGVVYLTILVAVKGLKSIHVPHNIYDLSIQLHVRFSYFALKVCINMLSNNYNDLEKLLP